MTNQPEPPEEAESPREIWLITDSYHGAWCDYKPEEESVRYVRADLASDPEVVWEISRRLTELENLLDQSINVHDRGMEIVPDLEDVSQYVGKNKDTFATDHTERLQPESGERVCEWEKIEVMFQSDSDGYDTDCKPEMIPVKKPNWGEHCPGCGGCIEILDSEEQKNE